MEEAAAVDWRVSVQQSYRNTEVREIARVLAALEPGASAASKLRLAMQFEDSVFKSATSLADYRKRLTKRLKKVQKSYVPPAHPTTHSAQRKEDILHQLRMTYREPVLYVLRNAEAAIAEMGKRHGEEKAAQLKQHTDGVKLWATDLGLVDGNGNLVPGTSIGTSGGETKPLLATAASSAVTPNYTMSEEHLEKLKSHLERRLENIRSHVVKLADPDQFVAETLTRVETDWVAVAASTAQSNAQQQQQPDATKLSRAVKILAECTRRRYMQLHKQHDMPVDGLLQDAMQHLQRPVPLPTRQEQESSVSAAVTRYEKNAALIHLDRMRAASTVLLAYMGLRDKTKMARHTLNKAHGVALEGTDFVCTVMKKFRQHESQTATVTLEDAWMKPLTLIYAAAASTSDEAVARWGDDGDETMGPPAAKRVRMVQQHRRLVLRCRVLLTAGRKTPFNLLPALKRKRARLVRPPGDGSHVILDFGRAFVMTIYFVPLLVTLRAMAPSDSPEEQQPTAEDKNDLEEPTSQPPQAMNESSQCAIWTPLHANLIDRPDSSIDDTALTVWGCKGSYDMVGPLIEERLRDASMHATHILRQCFAHTVRYHNSTGSPSSDFDVELLEATALMEFMQLARTTFIPNWQDDES